MPLPSPESPAHLLTRFQSALTRIGAATGHYFRPMREDSSHVDSSVLASSTGGQGVLAATAASADAPVALPRLSARVFIRIPQLEHFGHIHTLAHW